MKRIRMNITSLCRIFASALVVHGIVPPLLGAPNVLPVKLLDGTPVVATTISKSDNQLPGYLAIDLGVRAPLLLHTRSAAVFEIQSRGTVDVAFQGNSIRFSEIDTVAQELEPLETLTRKFADELQSVPVVGVLGLPAFAGYRVELNLGERRIGFEPISSVDGPLPDPLDLNAEAYGYWLTARGPDESALRTRLTTSEAWTRISADQAAELGYPGGDVPHIMLGGINLSEYAIFRPSDFSVFPEPRPHISLGTRFMTALRVLIDVDARQIAFIPTSPPDPPLYERAFFVARAAGDIAGVETFLNQHGDSALAPEASETLLLMRLDQPDAQRAMFRTAFEWIGRTAAPQRQAQELVRVADEMIALEDSRADALDLALLAVEVGRQYASEDLNATAIHHFNAREGLVALMRGDYTAARRLLLSAAFSLPNDPYVNFWLGHLYEQTDQRARAWSRYLAATFVDDPPIGAIKSIGRLNNDPDFRSSFSLHDAAMLLEGRIERIGVAELHDPAKDPTPALVELFTSVNAPPTEAGEIAFDALVEYFASSPTVCVQHHLQDTLATDHAMALATRYGISELPALVVDGRVVSTAGGDERRAAEVYKSYRAALGQATTSKTRGELALRQTASGWRATFSSDETSRRDLRLHVLLCERLVMLIGPNQRPLHHHVARLALTPENGLPVRKDETVTLPFTLEQAQREIAAQCRAVEPNAPMHPTYVDPSRLMAVAYVVESNHQVVAAAQTDLSPASTKKAE
jgi:hypothetical protein